MPCGGSGGRGALLCGAGRDADIICNQVVVVFTLIFAAFNAPDGEDGISLVGIGQQPRPMPPAIDGDPCGCPILPVIGGNGNGTDLFPAVGGAQLPIFGSSGGNEGGSKFFALSVVSRQPVNQHSAASFGSSASNSASKSLPLTLLALS